MKRSMFVVAMLLLAAVIASPLQAEEGDAVRKMIQDYVMAFNAKDSKTVLSYWTENSVHVDQETGERTEGREAIGKDIQESFQLRPEARLVGSIDRLRFITPDVVNVKGQVTVTNPADDPVTIDFSAMLVGKEGKWMIDSIEESPAPVPSTSFEALRELDWLVGQWTDESDAGRTDNVFRWSPTGSFLIRSFASESSDGDSYQGTQVIGWDPRSLEIRSWTFNSDGSFGDATWSKSGDDWLIKSSQTLADGQAASGTFVLSRNGDDELTLQLIGHEVEGEPQPTESSVTAIRINEDVSETTSPSIPSAVAREEASDVQ